MLDASKRAIDLHAIGEKIEFSDARERTRGRRSDGIITLGPGRDGPVLIFTRSRSRVLKC